MRGTNIINMSCDPRGRYLEGIIDDTSKPGTCMQITPGSMLNNGRHHWEHYQAGADADPMIVAVLLDDPLQGFPVGTAYVSGSRCFLYVPLPGDELNMLVLGQQGTGSADAFTVGERLTRANASGKLIKQATAANAAEFVCLEHIDLPADTDGLVWCMRQ